MLKIVLHQLTYYSSYNTMLMIYTNVFKTSFNDQGSTRKDCFQERLKEWMLEITKLSKATLQITFCLEKCYAYIFFY